ncbi:MAG: hypothetical protein ACXACG_18440 [Candidatus Thorarchaeota archaeon]|jgi:hypothetical protein
MRKRGAWSWRIPLLLILIIPTLSVSLIRPTAAANNQGLDWTIELGIYNYTLTSIPSPMTSTPPGEHDVYVNLTAIPPIYDDMNSPDYFRPIHDTHYQIFFQNGTVYPDGYYNFMIIPTGNWSAVQEIWEIELETTPTLWIDTVDEWGFDHVITDGESILRSAMVFSKTSGLLLHYMSAGYYYELLVHHEEFILDSYEPSLEPVTIVEPQPTSEGLEWDLALGETIPYYRTIETDGIVEIDSMRVDVKVDLLPPIPDPLIDITLVMLNRSHYTVFDENGTHLADNFEWPEMWTALPINNLDLVKEKIEETPEYGGPTFEWRETSTSWGFKTSSSLDPTRIERTFMFSKSDGALDRYLYEDYLDGVRVEMIELIRVGYEPVQPQDTLIFVVGGFGLVIAIVLIAYIVKYRSSRSHTSV